MPPDSGTENKPVELDHLGPQSSKIVCLLKVGKRENLEKLADGTLYCRHLSFYKRIEGAAQAWQDENEGLAAVYQSERIIITLQPSTGGPPLTLKTETGLTGQVLVSADYNTPAFCLHAIHTGEWTNKPFTGSKLDEFKRYLAVPERMDEFDRDVLIVLDAIKFLERVDEACKRLRINYARGLVRYIDPAEFHGNVPDRMAGFAKLRRFSPEREYRFIFSTPWEELPDPFSLDVGSLRDITKVVSLDEFRSGFSIGFEEP